MVRNMTKKKTLIYNSFFNVLYQLLNVIFPFITSIYVSHILMAQGVGKVAYAQNIASYFVTLAPLGLVSYGVKEIAKVKDDQKKRNQCFSELFFINAISTVIFSALYYLMIFRLDAFSGEKILYVVCGSSIILNIINVDWFYQGMEEYAYITVRSFFVKIFSIILLFLLVQNKTDYVHYALISIIAGCANRIFNIIYLKKFVKLQWEGIQWQKHMKPVLILACNILLANIYSKVDITMLGYLKNDAVTGYYTNAFKIVNIMLSLCIAMTDVFLPRLSFIYCSDRKKYQELLNQGIEIVLAIIFPVSIGLSLLAYIMIPILFGTTFVPASLTVVILSPLILIKGFGNLACYQVAISSGNEKKQTVAYVCGCMVNIVLNALLIPKMNQNGAAIASVASEFVLNTILFWQLRKLSGIHIKWQYFVSVLKSCLIMSASIIGVLKIFPQGLAGWIAIVIGGTVYVVSGYFFGNQLIQILMVKVKDIILKVKQR